LRLKVSPASNTVSAATETPIVFLVSPGLNVIVPLAAA